MNFKKDKYEIIPNAISDEMANFLYLYSLLKRRVAKTFMDTRRISRFTKDFGTWTDPQMPNTYSVYGDIAMDTLLYKMGPIMEKKSGYELVPTYSYMRVYKKGDVLKRHKDRMSCEVSITMNLGGDPWPIYLSKNTKDGKETSQGYKPSKAKGIKVNLNPGDMLIYRGCELEHWRNKFEGKECAQVFLHYNKAGKNSNLMDGRLHLGLPSDIKMEVNNDRRKT
jgi:hypothetical protein|tara:strand:- start:1549 stop:2217 length:669 start_codon:yes stop_codon:yes gene_type:complete